jgi:hypothetical protein
MEDLEKIMEANFVHETLDKPHVRKRKIAQDEPVYHFNETHARDAYIIRIPEAILEIIVEAFEEAYLQANGKETPAQEDRTHNLVIARLYGDKEVRQPNGMTVRNLLEEYNGYRVLDVYNEKRNLLYKLKDKIREVLDEKKIDFDYEQLKTGEEK